jgi:predicted nuclease of predicted toxin-antitoxin system
VLKFAQAEERILLTFDKDFGELAFVTELPATSGIILLTNITENDRFHQSVGAGLCNLISIASEINAKPAHPTNRSRMLDLLS